MLVVVELVVVAVDLVRFGQGRQTLVQELG